MIDSVNVIVDEAAIEHNTKLLRQTLKPETKIISVIKANGYGCGLTQVAHTCEKLGIDMLAVLDVDQAVDLRNDGITLPIILLGATLESNFQYLIDFDLTQAVINMEYAHKLDAFAKANNTKIKGHIKVDTGLNRLGLKTYEEVRSCYDLEGLDITGIYSHFVEAQSYDGDATEFSKNQIRRFNEVLEKLHDEGIDTKMTHMQNSPSIIHFGDLGYSAVRCGMVMFGLYHPSQLNESLHDGYKPVLSMEARICMVKEIKKGEFVGYGRTFTATRDMKLATVTAGYCDGVMKSLSLNGGGVMVNGHHCLITGDIAMSQFMIDVTGIDCEVEDKVMIFGHEDQTIYDYIQITGQSINELISLIRYTVPRIYVNPIK